MEAILQNPQQLALVVTALVALLAPVLVMVLRKWWPEFSVGPAREKLVVALLVAAIPALFLTPGDGWMKLMAAIAAAIGAQGVYGTVRSLRQKGR